MLSCCLCLLFSQWNISILAHRGPEGKVVSSLGAHLKLLHGCTTQFPTAFWRCRSLSRAFRLPNNFIDSLLSETWKNAMNWSRTLIGDVALFDDVILDVASDVGAGFCDVSAFGDDATSLQSDVIPTSRVPLSMLSCFGPADGSPRSRLTLDSSSFSSPCMTIFTFEDISGNCLDYPMWTGVGDKPFVCGRCGSGAAPQQRWTRYTPANADMEFKLHFSTQSIEHVSFRFNRA